MLETDNRPTAFYRPLQALSRCVNRGGEEEVNNQVNLEYPSTEPQYAF